MKGIDRVYLASVPAKEEVVRFREGWGDVVRRECHCHEVWESRFAKSLRDESVSAALRLQLAAVWACNMVVGSYCFPRYVAALAARAEADAVRHGLLENAWDESGGVHHTSRSHFWLAVRLARLLGLSDEEIEALEPIPMAKRYADAHFEACARGDFEHALGMICLIEEFTTPEFTLIFDGFLSACRKGLEMSESEFVLRGGAEYFTANITDDERHREEMPLLVATVLKGRGVDLMDVAALAIELASVVEGIRESINLRQQFFEAIYEYVKEGGTYRGLVGAGEKR